MRYLTGNDVNISAGTLILALFSIFQFLIILILSFLAVVLIAQRRQLFLLCKDVLVHLQ